MSDEFKRVKTMAQGKALGYDSWRLRTLTEEKQKVVQEHFAKYAEAVKAASMHADKDELAEARDILEQLKKDLDKTIAALRSV
jgi:hypothetical protein